MKHKKCLTLRCLLTPMALLAFVTTSVAQISGTVKDGNGEPLVGVSVLQKGTTRGVVSDLNGIFNINVEPGTALKFSSIGYNDTEEPATDGMTVTLEEGSESIDDVIITAMGISREKKTLGYAVQDVKGDVILERRDVNVANSLSGEIAGLQVVRSSNGPAGSSRILLRGNNSLSGNNQPLIVVDGMPIDNFTGADNNDWYNPSVDKGNGLQDINPEDIASISVLKGASAAALYGSRAGNGVILITTKSGKSSQGIGISISGTLSLETIFMRPKTQNIYGQGTQGLGDPLSALSWGNEGTTYNNVDKFIQLGINSTENITLQQQYGETSIYTSITRTDDKSMIPGTKLSRTNISTRASSYLGKDKKWFIDTKVQYINTSAYNRLANGKDGSSFATLYTLPRSINIDDWKESTDAFGNMRWWTSNTQRRNPYWNVNHDLNQDSRDRFLMVGSLKYFFTDWLNLEAKGGTDMYFNKSSTKTYGGSPLTRTGRYSVGKNDFIESNYSFLLTAKKDNLFDRFGGMFMLGGNLMEQKVTSLSSNSGELKVANLFSLNNGISNPTVSESYTHKKINSLYGTLQLNWDSYLFLDFTLRNDWSSTLSKANRSFAYPSVSVSWVVTDMLQKTGVNIPNWFSFGKIRASYAQVGNDLSPYQLYNIYTMDKDPSGESIINKGNILFNPDVKSELISSFEVGADIKFLDNRLGVDFAYYKSNATNQLIDLPIDPIINNGYSAKKINAGNIQNSGFEVQVYANIIRTRDFTWDAKFNFSTNVNIVKELAEGVTQYGLGGAESLQILAVEGKTFGEIYGTKYKRVEETSSPYYGRIILDEEGLPLADEKKYLGNQQSSALAGLGSTLTWKGLSFSFLIDARFGGQMFSATHHLMQNVGTAEITKDRSNKVFNGVIRQGDGSYIENTKSVSAQQYWEALTSRGNTNLGINEVNMYDATNIRIRNIALNYEINREWLKKSPFQRIKIGVMCNNVAMLYSKMNGIDPESVYNTATNATGFESFAAPTSRSFIFNLTLGF